jgi:hypothetical protein
MIGAISINQLEGDDYKRGTAGTWAERFERYEQQAREDFAMYEWLQAQGNLPAPEQIDETTARAWRMAKVTA